MRGIAAITVVCGHAYQAAGSPYPDLLLPVVLFGNSGVDLFFVLSGFCLYYPLTQPGSRPNWRTFFYRRARRLLPPYYAALACVVLLPLIVEPVMHALGLPTTPVAWAPWRQVWTHALFLQTLFHDTYYDLNGPLWSLAVEWQFYLAFPLAVLLLRWLGWRAVVLIGMLTLGYRIIANANWLGAQNWDIDIADLFPSRWLEFVLGMLVASLIRRRAGQPIGRARELSDLAGIGCLYAFGCYVLYGPLAQYPYPSKDLLNSLLWAPVLYLAASGNSCVGAAFRHPVLVWLGLVSYSLYLIHLPLLFSVGIVVAALNLGQPLSLLAMLAAVVPLALGCAALFFHLFERPFLRAPRTVPLPARLKDVDVR